MSWFFGGTFGKLCISPVRDEEGYFLVWSLLYHFLDHLISGYLFLKSWWNTTANFSYRSYCPFDYERTYLLPPKEMRVQTASLHFFLYNALSLHSAIYSNSLPFLNFSQLQIYRCRLAILLYKQIFNIEIRLLFLL